MSTQEQTRTAWDQLAEGFDEFVTPTNIGIARNALERVGLRSGMRFLDVACGTGALSIPAARLGAEVLATDVSPTMIEHLASRAQTEGLSNLQGKVMDGQALDLEDDSFDAAGSQFGVMLFPDMPQGIREMARVTRPGGRVLVVAFADPSKVEFFSFTLRAVGTAAPDFKPFPPDQPPLPFQLGDPETFRQELVSAGLDDVRIDTITATLEFDSARDMLQWVSSSNPIGKQIVSGLTEAQQTAVGQELETMLRERSGGSGPARLENAVHIGVGTKR